MLHGSLIAPGVARFTMGPRTPPPFPAYVRQPVTGDALPLGFPVRPRHARHGRRSVVSLTGLGFCDYYGTGEQAGRLRRKGARKVLWNYDSYDYTDRTPSLYQSHPFLLALPREGRGPGAIGVIVETTHRCMIDLTRPARGPLFEVDGPPPAVVVIARDTPRQVVESLASLTGVMPMPPRWALGFHQCRFSYETAAQAMEVARGFRERSIPCDALWLDIDYMEGYRSFTFNPAAFPDPEGLVAALHELDFRVVCMLDPGLKVDDAYAPYSQGREQGHFITDAAGGECHAHVWPGLCAFPDFTRARTRDWWAGLCQDLLAIGIDGLWNDMNEPAAFGVPSKTLPLDARHDADADLGGPGPHARYHNLYGDQMARATRQAMASYLPHRRPFVLTRAGFLGTQRTAATWTGDNRADDRHFRWSIPMALNLGLSGQPFCGPDIGGFIGDSDPELFARWMGVGTLLPFARAHKNKGTRMHEPWELGEECERTCRLALERRYRLLPYLYTLFREASITGVPVARPLFFEDPGNRRLRTIDDAFLLGEHVLVGPPGASAGEVDPHFETWAAFELTAPDPRLPSLHLRPGTIVPVGPVVQHTAEAPLDPLTLLVHFRDGHARGTLYEDDGESLAYAQGEFLLTEFEVERGREVQARSTGSFKVPPRRIALAVLA